MLTAENGRVGMKVVAKVTLTSVQGWRIAQGTVGEVKVMHKTAQLVHCPTSAKNFNGIVSVRWKGYDNISNAIYSAITNISIQC